MGRRRAAARKWQLSVRGGAAPRAEEPILDPIESLVAQARKLRKRGDRRRALVTLREAANRDEWRARTWTLLGALLEDMGHRAEAAEAFHRARWLRARAGDKARAAVNERLAARVAEAA
jgi:Flp pilus assembly protein TadD